jgi:hypothetical protein
MIRIKLIERGHMKLIAKFLTLLICFELIVAPIGTNLGIINNTALAQTLSCPAGQVPNAELNRCLTTDQAAQVMQATRNCGGDMNCYITNASSALDNTDVPEFRQLNRFAPGMTKLAALMMPILMAKKLVKLKGNPCAAISYGLIVGAGAALIGIDIFINKAHYDRLAGYRKDWGKIVNPTSVTNDIDKQEELSINAQSEAFQKLADAEGSMATAANSKQTLYNSVAAAYAAALILAIIELTQPTKFLKKCTKIKTDASETPKTEAKPTEQPKTPPPVDSEIQGPTDLIEGSDFFEGNFGYNKMISPELESQSKMNDSLYEYYTQGSKPDFFYNKQFFINISKSQNLTSLILNQKALNNKFSTPTINEYELINNSLKEVNDAVTGSPEVFELIKIVSSKVISEIDPFPNAVAKNENRTNASMAYEHDAAVFEGWGYMLVGAAAGTAMYFGKWAEKFDDFMMSSWGRVIVGGVLATSTFFLARHAKNVEADANTRKDKLLELKAEFNVAASSIDTCKSEDRDNPGKPNCYCYTPKNQRNPNRYNSQVCSRLWGGANVNFKKAANYSSDQKICMTKTYNPDPLCSCRKTASCLKSSVGKMQGISAGTLTMLNSGLGPMNSLTSGDASLGQIGSTNPGSTAIRMLSAVDKLLGSKPMAKHKGLLDKGAKELTTSMNQAVAQIPQQSLASSGSGALPTNAKEAAKMLEKELAPPTTANAVDGNQGTIATPTGSEEKMPEFGLSEEQAALQESQIAEVMDKNLDYGGTDINNAPSANIFEVLTNRYKRSGMRRLFDENNKTPAEAPSKSDINK